MSSMEEGGGAVGAVFTDQAIINNNTNNDSVSIDMSFTEVPISDGELANLQSAFDGAKLDHSTKQLIQRVPSTLGRHEDFWKYFKPKVISIGPLHHDDPTLHKSKKLKLELATHFIKKIDVDKDTLYNNMKAEMDDLKKCYDPKELEKYSKDNEKLAWMFFVDSCVILQAVYMLYCQYYHTSNELYIKNKLLTFVYSDLFLLENQLPFRVLELLTSSSKNGEKFMEAIKRFINRTVNDPQSDQQDSEWWPQQGERIHLLHLLRLPPITVDDSTMNLIACEMCPDFHNNFTVTSYMGFLDSLIDEVEDVKELRDAGILYNRLGSDKEVAKLIKKMNIDLVPSLMIYRLVKWKIHDHCKTTWINLAAQGYQTYFRSPWTFLALVGAITTLLLSALQTYYTIHQPK
ncbi:hypothetical protein E1A91_A11G344900v1 [Gossypium mustelinum]|uniref:Uncharacterized protein n=1 Tax=Gossypium mustelinum TaxID=34275 RepID=A0A5D2XFB5_GOSMU|nr:hypothetical protein E1A91_A11G344900v1 [Gossypium mustelinum]